MATIINASNSTGLTLTSDLSGVLQLQQNGVALPALSVAPAFSAYASVSQNLTASTFTKLQANVEEWDTNNNYDATTNYRFTPTVAGYYQLSGGAGFTALQNAELLIVFYKNNARYKYVCDLSGSNWGGWGSALVYANGTTDYFELYMYTASTGTKTTDVAVTANCYFQGCLVRGA